VGVIGAAGTIGRTLVRELLAFGPASLDLLDTNENDLALLARDLRELRGTGAPHVEALPIGLGTPELLDFVRARPAWDVAFHVAGLKHVSSEASVYSLRRLLDVNCLASIEWLEALPERRGTTVLFASTDPQANPASLMAASKLAFESLLVASDGPSVVTRFSAVAFSQGSLLDALRHRLREGKPLWAPAGVRRAFVSRQEAAQLCLLSAALARPGALVMPRADRLDARSIASVVRDMVHATGVDVLACGSDAEAAEAMSRRTAGGPWPCCFHSTVENPTASPTSLAFLEAVETTPPLSTLQAFCPSHPPHSMSPALSAFRTVLEAGRRGGVSREAYVQALAAVVPGLTGR
jgi:FlaA1/EpsC-like NDP-sugar epimerase